MMKQILFVLVVLLAANGLFAQGISAGKAPDTEIRVNKEYDENGNLIRYDSSYVRSWSSDSTFTMMNIDSLHNQMGFFFGTEPDFFKLDSAFFGGTEPFGNLHKNFFKQHDEMMKRFRFEELDSSFFSFPDFSSSFPDIDQLRKEMEQNFKQYFGTDSTQIDFEGVE